MLFDNSLKKRVSQLLIVNMLFTNVYPAFAAPLYNVEIKPHSFCDPVTAKRIQGFKVIAQKLKNDDTYETFFEQNIAPFYDDTNVKTKASNTTFGSVDTVASLMER